MNIHEVVIILLAVTVLVLGINHINLKGDLARSERTLSRVTQHLDSKSGGTKLLTGEMINYNLKTFDGGKHWYAVERIDAGGVIILGEAEEVYPGLLKHLDALDNLISHGPITNSADLDLLRAVGFTVTEKE